MICLENSDFKNGKISISKISFISKGTPGKEIKYTFSFLKHIPHAVPYLFLKIFALDGNNA